MKPAMLTPPGARVDVAFVADPVTTSDPLPAPLVLGAPTTLEGDPGRFADFCELIKARLTAMVLVTTLAGFYLGWAGAMDWRRLGCALFGTWLVASGSAALNELIERRTDAAMHRTRNRPLPSGRMRPDTALLIGFALAVAGLACLYFLVNLLAATLAALTMATYLFAYTPLKRRTTLNTLVGAIPGALPPMIGWAAARGTLDKGAWALFAILFCWQMPHFLAIAWLYREDYARAGFVMLPNVDETGEITGRQATNYALTLLLVSLVPGILGMAGRGYFAGAFVLGVGMIFCAVRMQLAPGPTVRATAFFRLDYLPAAAAGVAGLWQNGLRLTWTRFHPPPAAPTAGCSPG